MTDRRELAFVQTYDQLIGALRARADELEVTREVLDSAAGIQSGYSAKLLAPVPIRALGRISLGSMLGALGIALVVVEDKAALERIGRQLTKRKRRASMLATRNAGHKKHRKRWRFPKGADHARLMRARQMANQTPEERSAIARQAAQARWARRRQTSAGE